MRRVALNVDRCGALLLGAGVVVAVPEAQTDVETLLGVDSLDDPPCYALAARRTNTSDPLSAGQIAWLGKVRHTAASMPAAVFDDAKLSATAAHLARTLMPGPKSLPQVPGLFAECGVWVVFCEGLKGGKLDGAAMFLPDRKAVIGLTTRENRFDIVLFTLLHECAHITLGHVTADTPDAVLDEDVATPEAADSAQEAAADSQANRWLLPDGFKTPAATLADVRLCAGRFGLHLSVVIGQIQRETGRWDLLRRHVPSARAVLEDAKLLA